MPADRLDAAAPDTADRDLAVVDASVFAALALGESKSQEAADLHRPHHDPHRSRHGRKLDACIVSAHDAAYVQIARKLGALPHTFDERLAQAARSAKA